MCIEYDSINRKLSISEMAQIHNITRQTLIYYDKIGLFKPDIIESNGYRYYSTTQIPLLREICFLRSIGMSLDDIRKNNTSGNSTTTIALLESQNDKLQKEIDQLRAQQKQISSRIRIYRNATTFRGTEYKPSIQHFPQRTMLYHEWESGKHCRRNMHYALMRGWNEAEKYGLLPSNRYGTLYFKEDLEKGQPLSHAGACFEIGSEIPSYSGAHVRILKEGDYVCMQKFGMSYDTIAMKKLLHWIEENNYVVDGDIYDECLMDASFYEDEYEPDFCELQIPIARAV